MAKRANGKAPAVGDKPFLHISLRAFAHATEDRQCVKEAMAFAAGFNLQDPEELARFDKITKQSESEGYFHNPIAILETEVTRSAEVKRFWRRILKDERAREKLAREIDKRLDDDLVFWMRIDKQAAAQGWFKLGAGEDVVQVRAKLATYPKDRAVGMGFLATFFEAAESDESDERQTS